MSAAHELPVLVTVDEAAESLSLHPDQVRRLVRRGELVGYRLGRAVRIDADSVRAYVARCRLASESPSPRSISRDHTSSAAPAGRAGMRAEDPSGASPSRSGRQTAPRQSADCANDSTPSPADPWTKLRAKYRSQSA